MLMGLTLFPTIGSLFLYKVATTMGSLCIVTESIKPFYVISSSMETLTSLSL